MSDKEHFEISVKQEVGMVKMDNPHVVILGAGASRASCLDGDKTGQILPLMQDFNKVLGLSSLLNEWGIDPDENIESVYSDLFVKHHYDKTEQIENAVENYFTKLCLPEHPTIYDHLILSLRKNDVIATFNWDPLLIQAAKRNAQSGFVPPRLLFLHGNVSAWYCEKDKIWDSYQKNCAICGKPYKRSPLLYPVKDKDYGNHFFIKNQWSYLEAKLKNAFMVTIFGYSAPKTDEAAKYAMHRAWGNSDQREMEQFDFVTPQGRDEIYDTWESFIHTHHFDNHECFYDSWIANHPRRTGEAYLNQYFDARFISNNPIPRDFNFHDLWRWFQQFKEAEN